MTVESRLQAELERESEERLVAQKVTRRRRLRAMQLANINRSIELSQGLLKGYWLGQLRKFNQQGGLDG